MAMHIGHVAIRSTDVDLSAEHLRRVLGLRETTREAGSVYLSANHKHHEVQLIPGTEAGFDHVGLELDSDDELEDLRRRVLAAGARILEADRPEPGLGRSMRFVGPAGMVYEAYTAMKRRPLGVELHLAAGPRRLGHLTFFCADHAAIRAFWIEALGFRVSDTTPDGIAWLRCDADHHGLAVAPRSEGNVLHHHAWELQDLSALGKQLDHLALDGDRIIWGPVRHGPGFNIATYMLEPEGAVIEMYTDLLRIEDEATYVPVDWSHESAALNLWGPPPPDVMLQAGVPVLPPTEG